MSHPSLEAGEMSTGGLVSFPSVSPDSSPGTELPIVRAIFSQLIQLLWRFMDVSRGESPGGSRACQVDT